MDERREFGFIAVTPAGMPDPSLAIAGSRAGALGVLNLEFSADPDDATRALAMLVTHGRGRRGFLIDGGDVDLLTTVLDAVPAGTDTVLITASALDRLEEVVGLIHRRGLRAYLVASSSDDGRAGVAAGIDAIVAKGHEAGGWVGEETSFVLLQHLLGQVPVPIWAQGGVGLHTVAACYIAGAAGAVLDSQLLLTRESPLPDAVRTRISTMDGSETACLGAAFGTAFRAYLRPNLGSSEELRGREKAYAMREDPPAEIRRHWREAVRQRVDYRDAGASVLAVGQDAAFAAGLARRFGTVGRVIAGLREAIHGHLAAAQGCRPLAENAPLGASHGTRYPIVQGPMTRVSDRAEFAAAVAQGGALPFLALALMRGPEVRELLVKTRRQLGDRPWGVGILGFVPADLRQEQLEIVRQVRPPFALIAGGRPDQARALEDDGIQTYLHVPSPGLLRIFLQDGARRFVFEGGECGGHVGPRSSFVLWESMIEVLLEHVPADESAAAYHLLFAGGVHDELSAAMVAALAAPLAERGVRIGVLLGTAYVFTEEAVRAGAILPGFQQAAVACDRTDLLESGPGHATRCLPSPFVEDFEREKRLFLRAELSSEEIRNRLEELNIGRLRIASKGLDRHPRFGHDPDAPKLIELGADEQWARGMYMIGQVAALRDRICTIAELHRDVSTGGTLRLATADLPVRAAETPAPAPAAVAIVGMACVLPGAPDLATYWGNILNKVDAITEVPPSRWDWRHYYDPDRNAKDKVYSRWGGFLSEIPFDPMTYGMPPNTLRSIEPFQLLTLHVVRCALQDAGYLDRPFPRERTSVILGSGGGAGDLAGGYVTRSNLPTVFGSKAAELVAHLEGALPEWTEDSFAGILMNVAAGRVANRFDLGGVNYTVDAACASSLAAVYLAVRDLEARTSDVVIVGGVDTIQNPFAFLCFSKTQALSPTGRCRTFDADADGIAIGEGVAMLVLKRLDDAERDGDQIYATIRAVGGSSDGRDRGLTAPRPEGQMRALERAYAQARFSPASMGLIEAHGTGTVAGDQAEVQALTRFFGRAGAGRQSIAIGSVKSMIGHTKATAGVAGLTKVALALHHRVLPPTLGVTRPNPQVDFGTSPLYVNSETRPWINGPEDEPRRAGVSAFGFGGTNFHVVLEEYTGSYLPEQSATLNPWPAELFAWRGRSRGDLLRSVGSLGDALRAGARPRLTDLAFTLALELPEAAPDLQTLAIVAESLDDLQAKLAQAADLLRSAEPRRHDLPGLHYAETSLLPTAILAHLFPGQGSQHVNMLRDLALVFPDVRDGIGQADQVLADQLPGALSGYIYPPPTFTKEEAQRQQAALTDTNVAQPALGAVSLALSRLLRSVGLEPQMAAGHSYGELAALCIAGCFDEATLLRLSEARGRFMREAAGTDSGTMAAIDAGPEVLRSLLADLGITLANMNAPQQTVIAGSRANVDAAIARCKAGGLTTHRLDVACAFHSPLVEPAQRRFAELLKATAFATPRIPVYSNTTASRYPDEPATIVELLSEHLVRPVEFVREVEEMYQAGARVFVEVGPRSVLTRLVGRVLGDRPHLAVALDQSGRPGVVPVLQAIAAVAAEGGDPKIDHLFQGRARRRLDLSQLARETGEPRYSPTTWLVDGGRARPATQAKPTIASPIDVAVVDATRPMPRASVPGEAVARPRVEPVVAAPAPPAVPPTPRPMASSTDSAAGHATAGNFINSRADPPAKEKLAYLQAPGATVADVYTPPAIAPARNGRDQAIVAPRSNGEMTVAVPASPPAGAPVAQPAPPAPTPSPVQTPPRQMAAATAPPTPVVESSLPVKQNGAPHAEQSIALPPTTSKREAATAITRDELTTRLLGIVSERTGYPTDMLGLDIDLEADLGIDSIKRVEIVGTVVRGLTLPPGVQFEMETLTGSRSLNQLLDRLLQQLSPSGAEPDDALSVAAGSHRRSEGDQRPFEEAAAEALIGRFTLRPALAPPPQEVAELARSGVVVIADDGRGIARDLEDPLARLGYRAVRVVGPGGETAGETSVLAADVGRPEDVAQLVERLRAEFGRVVALVHLAALRPGTADAGFELDRWRARLVSDLEGFFLLTQALQPDLEAAARDGGAAVLAATELGGTFAVGEDRAPMFPGHAGQVGFLKTLAEEWTNVRVKAVDLGPAPADRRAAWVWSEPFAADGIVEVGYRDERRYTIELDAVRLDRGTPKLELDPNSVVLLTGGARGITALAAQAIAERYRPTLVLLGRTRPPEGPEPPETAALSEPAQLKRAIIDRRRRQRQSLALAAVEAEYEELWHQREVRATLAQLRETDASVSYYPCNAADPRALAATISEVYRAFGRIDAVIHGAGIIEDKLVRDKKLDSFRRVIRTKVDSALTLAANLRPETLRFLVYFSSVSGRFGNRGQADYAAASEILNKLAVQLDRQWPGHVVSINWGPWLTTGMATPEIQRQLAERGVELISPKIGCRRLLEELDFGSKGNVEVVVGGFSNPKYRVPTRMGARRFAEPASVARNVPEPDEALQIIGDVRESPYPLLLAGGATMRRDIGRVEVVRTLDLAADPYLDDHRLDGRPVLPGAMALELIAEAASAGWPGLSVAAVRRLRLLRGVVLDQERKSIRIVAEPIADPASAAASDPSLQVVRVALLPVDNARQAYYDGVVELSAARAQATPGVAAGSEAFPDPSALQNARPPTKSMAEVYRNWLFHGPRFQNIASIEAVGPGGVSATFRLSSPRQCLAGEVSGAWLIDPVIVDCCLQLQIVWARLWWGVTSLFSGLAEYRATRQAWSGRRDEGLRQPTPAGTVRCELRVLPESAPPTSRTRQYLYGADGALLAILDGTEMTGSSALNRLCDGPTPTGPEWPGVGLATPADRSIGSTEES